MDTSPIRSESSVEQILRQWPQASSAFIHLKTACVGCYISRFCTLEDVAAFYKLPIDALVKTLQESVQSPKALYKGEKNEVVL